MWVVAWESEDLPGQWVAECLDFHIVSQGNGPLHAIEMLQEAMLLVFEHDIAHKRNPFEVHRPSPKAAWGRLWDIVKHGELGRPGYLVPHLRENPETLSAVALQLELGLVWASPHAAAAKRVTIKTVPVAISQGA